MRAFLTAIIILMASAAMAADTAPPSIFAPIVKPAGPSGAERPSPAQTPGNYAPYDRPASTAPSPGNYEPYERHAYSEPQAAPAAEAPKFDIDYSIDLAISNPTLKLAFLHIKNGNPNEAAKDLAAYRPPTNPYPPLNFMQGLLYRSQGRMFDAVDSFRGAYVLSADQKLKELALFERSRTYLALKHHIEARADFMIFLKSFPNSKLSEEAHLGLGQALMGLKLYGEAIPSFQQAGQSAAAGFGEAEALGRMGRFDEAERAFREAQTKYPRYLQQSADARYMYGETLRQQGKLFDARQMLKDIQSGPDRERAALGLARIASAEGRDDEAISGLEALKSSQTRQIAVSALLELAAIQARTGRLTEARATLEEIRSKFPYGKEYDAAILGLARIDEAEGKQKDAMGHLRELVMRFQPEAKAVDEYENILKAYLKAGDDEDLKSTWAAIKKWMLDTKREATLLDIAFRLKKLGEPYLDTLQWVEENGSREGRTRALAELVNHYTATGDFQRARTYLDRLKTLQGAKGPDVQRADAAILFAEHDLKGATSRILSIKNPTEDDLLLLGQSYKGSSDPAKAAAYFERAVNSANDPSAAVLLSLADMLYDLGQRQKSLSFYEEAHARDATNEWATYRMAVMSSGPDQEELFKLISPGSSIIGKMAAARLREIQIEKALEGR